MKPGKHQRSKQRCQDLGGKVHDRAKPFVLRSYTMHVYVTNTFLLVRSSVRSEQLLCFVRGQGQKSEQRPATKKFVEFHNHSPLLTRPPWKQLYLCEKKVLIFIRIKLGMVFTCNSKYKPDEKRLKTARFPEFCGFFNPLILEISLICKYKWNSFKWIKIASFNPVRSII